MYKNRRKEKKLLHTLHLKKSICDVLGLFSACLFPNVWVPMLEGNLLITNVQISHNVQKE